MLQITIPAPESEDWDEENEEFIYHTVGKSYVLQLEHQEIDEFIIFLIAHKETLRLSWSHWEDTLETR